MQEFWLEYRFTDVAPPMGASIYDRMMIHIPDACPFCHNPLKISTIFPGNASSASALVDGCQHTMTYQSVYGMRIKNETPTIKEILSCKSCGTPNEYAVSNRSDGSYVCYSCRS